MKKTQDELESFLFFFLFSLERSQKGILTYLFFKAPRFYTFTDYFKNNLHSFGI